MAARAPSSSNFETLDEWIAATCHSFDVSIAVLSNWCELGSETLRGLCVDSDRALYPQTQRKLHDSLGVRFEELERLRPSAVTNSAQVQRLMHARSAGTTDSSKMCEKCGRCHRKAPPAWLGMAMKAYRAGDSYDTIAAYYGVSDTKVKHWLTHEGVEPRSRQASAERRAFNLGHTLSKCHPQPCACGCGQLTSGSMYQVSERVRRPALYVQGHEDSIVDLAITLESCLCFGERHELAYKFALRGVAALLNETNREVGASHATLRALYAARSDIVHVERLNEEKSITKKSLENMRTDLDKDIVARLQGRKDTS
jgi:hypothetical protein